MVPSVTSRAGNQPPRKLPRAPRRRCVGPCAGRWRCQSGCTHVPRRALQHVLHGLRPLTFVAFAEELVKEEQVRSGRGGANTYRELPMRAVDRRRRRWTRRSSPESARRPSPVRLIPRRAISARATWSRSASGPPRTAVEVGDVVYELAPFATWKAVAGDPARGG